MTSGDRDPLEGDPEWQAALLQYELSKRHNPAHTTREIEMTRGRLIIEKKINEQHHDIARHALSEKFNPEHDPKKPNPNIPDGRIEPSVREHRDAYRNNLPRLNGGQNK